MRKIAPKFIRTFRRDAWKQLHQALEGNFVARIGDKLQICRRVLDVRLLKKRTPLVMENGICRRVSSSCNSKA